MKHIVFRRLSSNGRTVHATFSWPGDIASARKWAAKWSAEILGEYGTKDEADRVVEAFQRLEKEEGVANV